MLPNSLLKKLDKQFKFRPFLANIQSYSGLYLGVVSLISIVKNIVTSIDFVIVDAETLNINKLNP